MQAIYKFIIVFVAWALLATLFFFIFSAGFALLGANIIGIEFIPMELYMQYTLHYLAPFLLLALVTSAIVLVCAYEEWW